MNGNRLQLAEKKARAWKMFLAWAQEYSPEWHAAIVEAVPDIPKNGGLNQLGESWDLGAPWDEMWPSMYYSASGYRGRWHSAGEHLSGLGQNGMPDPFGGVGVPTTPTTAPATGGDIWDKLSRAVDKGIEVAGKALPAYFTFKTQQDVAKINLERAKQGLPPLDPGATATQIRVVHDVNPQMQSEISRVFTTGNIVLFGALALGGILLFRMMAR